MKIKTVHFFVGLGAYFCLEMALRVWTSPSSHLDESEQLLLTQSLQWGYGPQPPLYTWLQWVVFQVTGPSVLGLSLLKNTLLFTICALAFSISRIATGSLSGAMLGACALVFIPDLAWEGQRDLTHTVLASACMLATVWGLLRVWKDGSWTNYLTLATIIGLGCLSKYNYLVGLTGLLVAALTLPEGRRLLLSRRFACGLLISALVIAPHALWGAGHKGLATASIGKLKLAAGSLPLEIGLLKTALLSLGMVAPSMLLLGAASLRCSPRAAPEAAPFVKQLLVRQIILAVVFVVAGMLISSASNVRGRWLLPLLVSAPLAGVAVFWPRLNEVREKWLMRLAMVIALIIAALLPARIVFAEHLGRLEPLHVPYSKLAVPILSQCESNTLLFAENPCVAGNLRLAVPACRVICPEAWRVLPHPQKDTIWFVWDATKSGPLCREQTDLLSSFQLRPVGAAQYIQSCYHYHTQRLFRLGMVRLEKKQNDQNRTVANNGFAPSK